MKVILIVVTVVWLEAGGVVGEADYDFAPRPRTVFVHHTPLEFHAPQLTQFVGRPRLGGFASSEHGPLGLGPPPPPPESRAKQQQHQQQRFRLPHPNSIRGEQKEGFEVVRAPVIYQRFPVKRPKHTVTDSDSDVTKALADAFGVVQKLRKPGGRQEGRINAEQYRTVTNFDHVNQQESQSQSTPGKTTTTTTIVVAPKPEQRGVVVTTSTAPVVAQRVQSQQQQQEQQLPAAADLPPTPAQFTVLSTSAPQPELQVVQQAQPQQPAPKLIIPSTPHVTTLGAVHSGDPQVRTIIQPVYIPYAVDQNGQPFGPLPDYHSMDFGALLNSQKQLLTLAAPTSNPTLQLVEAPQPQQQIQVQHQEQLQPVQQQQYVYLQDQTGAADTTSSEEPLPSPTSATFGMRIGRGKSSARRI